jgi:hypothetical protein
MFVPRSLRGLGLREAWLDPAVLLLEVRGEARPDELAERVTAAAGVRWLVLDLAGATEVPADLPGALLGPARALRAAGGELVLTGAPPPLGWDGFVRLRSVDEVLALLKPPRPGARPRARERVEALRLPRVDDPG